MQKTLRTACLTSIVLFSTSQMTWAKDSNDTFRHDPIAVSKTEELARAPAIAPDMPNGEQDAGWQGGLLLLPNDFQQQGKPNSAQYQQSVQFAASLDGLWEGSYDYPKNSGMPSVPFTTVLKFSADGTIKGALIEPNTFGNPASPHLSANIQGVWRGTPNQVNSITFSWIKTYDGTGGITHPVRYTGKLSKQNGRFVITGIWEINSSGGFVLRKIAPALPPQKQQRK